ncbi:HAMP domain-containing histidine kinase [bacterium]|nr:HAMP domain-containing histidine kinase [bacterium]
MRNKYNTLSKYIFENSEREYRKESIDALFRSILEPIVSNQKIEACVLLRLNEINSFDSLIKRLNFSGAKIIGYSDVFEKNYSNENLWGTTEFVVVLSQRYSAALIWDYSSSSVSNLSNICLLFNSKIISDIAKNILSNSTYDFKDLLIKYNPDRRENMSLNYAVNSISLLLNEKNEELVFSEKEKTSLMTSDDTYQTAQIVAEKAKYIAHEIKNNLSIINLYSKITEKRLENINMDKDVSDSVYNAIKNVTTASENISSLINDLRCLSAPYITEINLNEFIDNTIMLCTEKANNSKVKINTEQPEDIIIHTDKIKLQCALTNIIFNAIEACQPNDKVSISVNKNTSDVEIYIKNNGDIIPENLREKIFEVDFTTKKTGNGLGLAICKKQMQLLNGDIQLISSSEEETIFKIILPLK